MSNIELEEKPLTTDVKPMISEDSPDKESKIHIDVQIHLEPVIPSPTVDGEGNRSFISVDEDPNKEWKKNLMFDQKNISPIRLYCHLSEKTEVILMWLGLIGSFGAGIAGPMMALIFGNTSDTFANVQGEGINNKDFVSAFDNAVDEKVRQFLYIGTGMFFANFWMHSMWQFSGLRQMHHLKEKYFALILSQEQGWFDENNAYEFATKVQAQIEQIEWGVGEKPGQLWQMVAQFLTGIIISFTKSWKLALVILCVSPFILGCLVFLVTSMKKAIILSRKTYEKAGGVAEEMLYNIKTVASFANFRFENERFGKFIDRVHELDLEKAIKLSISIGTVLFFLNFAFVIAMLYSRKWITDDIGTDKEDKFTSGRVLTVIFSTNMAIMSIGTVAPNIKIIQDSSLASSDYFTLAERKPLIDLTNSNKKPPRDEVKGKIELRNISFSYPSDKNNRQILDNLSLVFEPGQKVALVGESGCGKSTTVNLIERLYEANSGEVFIDGIEIKEYDLQYLRTLIGYVQQEPVLFNRSIRENLLFGRENVVKEWGDIDKLIEEACEEAYAKEFINTLPDKYEYIVGIKGSKLSGGQKQRLAIARAILCKPKILILDEATSALDNKSEKEVQRALDRISQKNVTTVIIAHRLTTIKNADLIYAIKDGKVCEKGTHSELLARNGYYAGLVRSQLAQDELESKEENWLAKKKSSVHNSRMEKMGSKLSSHMSDMNAIETQLKQMDRKLIDVDRSKLFSLLSDAKWTVALGTFGAVMTGCVTPMVGYVLANSIVAISEIPTDPDDVNINRINKDGLRYAMWFLLVSFASGFSVFLKIWKFETIGSIISCKMRKLVIEKYLKLHLGYFDIDDNAPGAWLTKLSIDTTQLNSIILSLVGDAVACISALIVGWTMAFYFDYRWSLMALCFLPFIIIAQVSIVKTRRGGRDEDKKIDIEAGSVLSECVINTKTIYSFNFQKPAVEMYLNILADSKKRFTRDSFLKGILWGLGIFAMFTKNACIFNFAAEFIKEKTLTFQDMTLCMNVLMMMTNEISQNLIGVSEYGKAKKAFDSVFSTMNTESTIDTSEEANENKVKASNLKGKIEFKNVSFAYPTKPDQKILKNISLTIEAGQAAALVGYSGCGKSTIVQLLERFYDITEGEILIDGINIRDYDWLDLRRKIGLVSQEPVWFKRSVYENILYGRLDATKDEVFDAAKRACIEKFFNKKEMGTKEDPVSGGEKQRLAIARAFLKDPTILLWDEATSALDKESEIEVQKSIYEWQKNRTSISVAHRLSTIENSDIIFVLEAGKIVEKGNHNELLKWGGKYATLYKYSDSH